MVGWQPWLVAASPAADQAQGAPQGTEQLAQAMGQIYGILAVGWWVDFMGQSGWIDGYMVVKWWLSSG